ncbi:unnamed protein product [marine sediment metagenome]|uniref:Uncharacterized protein n=1 Tax=marine sediment metagenome TaxID=412755 RepID=X0S8N6_9ZZZZ
MPEEPCPKYDKIPAAKKAEINAELEKAKRAAKQKYEKAKMLAEEDKAKAKAAFDVAEQKHRSAKTMLEIEVADKKVEAIAIYDQCMRDAIPKNCTDVKDVPADKEAICYAQLKQNLKKEDLGYQQGIQKIDQEKSAAGSEWTKAQERYTSSVCIAIDVRKEAELGAEVQWHTALSKALEDVCKT